MTASRRVWGVAALVLVGFAVAPSMALAEQRTTIDLLTQANVRIHGSDRAGASVAGAGDVNGDGRADVILNEPFADNNGRTYSGSAYVVFGGASATTVDLDALGTGGFRIDGAAAYDAGFLGVEVPVAGAGDVNGDGLDDVIVGFPGADKNRRPGSGSAYVVFGRTSTAPVDLAALGAGGFRIDGAAAGDSTWWMGGLSVAGAGDVNGDGLDDVIVGTAYACRNGREHSGSAYVVFGKVSTSSVDLAALGARGYRIDGAERADGTGKSVAGAGDVNGDGRPDAIVGAPGRRADGRRYSGSAYVVFGKTSTTTIDLQALGTRGFEIKGAAADEEAGESVAGAGDVNGDGRADVIVGATGASNNRRYWSGSAYVVLGSGSTAPVDLAALGAGGFRIDGASQGDQAGESVSGIGDISGDGRAEVIVGAPGASNNSRDYSGSAYVVYGRTSRAEIDLGALGTGGVRIDGAGASDGVGYAVADAGDVNSDGRRDVLLGAPISAAGVNASAYIVYGSAPQPALSYHGDIDAYADEEIEPLEPSLTSTGSTAFTVSPPLPEGLVLDSGTGVISGTPTAAWPETTHTITVTDDFGSASAQMSILIAPDAHPALSRRSCRTERGNRNATPNVWVRAMEVTQGISGKYTRTFYRRASQPRRTPYDLSTRSKFYRWEDPDDPGQELQFDPFDPPVYHGRDDILGTSRGATRLVADKPTLVRVYGAVRGTRDKLRGKVLLHAYARQPDGSDGPELENSPLEWGERIPTEPTHMRTLRSRARCSFNFILPHEWIREARINLKAEISEDKRGFAECGECVDEANALTLTDLNFERTPDLPLTAIRLMWSGAIRAEKTENMDYAGQQINKAYPVAPGRVAVYHYPGLADIAPPRSTAPGEWDCDVAIERFAQWVYGLPGEPAPRSDAGVLSPNSTPNPKYAGYLPVTAEGSKSFDGCVGNAGEIGSRVNVTHGYNNHPDLRGLPEKRARRWSTPAHELGHNFALLHASEAHGEGGGIPWPDGLEEVWDERDLGGGSMNGYGVRDLDAVTPGRARRVRLITPGNSDRHTHDLMSYGDLEDARGRFIGCPTCWISPNTWNALMERMGLYPTTPPLQPPFAGLVSAAGIRAAGASRPEFVRRARNSLAPSQRGRARHVMTGAVLVSSSTGPVEHPVLDRLKELDGPPPAPKPVTSGTVYRLVGRDAKGRVVVEEAVEPRRLVTRGVIFVASLRLPASAVRVDLMRYERVVSSRLASANPPTVRYVGPRRGARWRSTGRYRVRWRVYDPDGDPLELQGQYRLGAGEPWIPAPGVGVSRTRKGVAVVDPNDFAPSRRVQIRLKVTDGFYTTFVVGPPFRVDPHPMKVGGTALKAAYADSAGGLNLTAFVVDPNTGQGVDSYSWYYRGRFLSRRSEFTTFRFRAKNPRKRSRSSQRTLVLVASGAYGMKARREFAVNLRPCFPNYACATR